MLTLVPLILLILISLGVIVWSADRFLDGATATATHMGASSLTIGLTLVALGTSGPEIAVTMMAAVNNTPGLAVGNVAGSNNANIGMVLGVAALYTAIPFPNRVIKVELPLLLIISLISLFLLFDRVLDLMDGLTLIATLAISVLYWRMSKNSVDAGEILPTVQSDTTKVAMSKPRAGWYFASGLVVLLISTELLVWSGSALAHQLGVSEMFIGLTFVAVGTSLPELAATIGSLIKGNAGLAIGNIVGSNILNLALVLGLVGVLSPLEVEASALYRDFIVVLAFTTLLAVFAYGHVRKPMIARSEGAILFGLWIAYNVLIIYQTLIRP